MRAGSALDTRLSDATVSSNVCSASSESWLYSCVSAFTIQESRGLGRLTGCPATIHRRGYLPVAVGQGDPLMDGHIAGEFHHRMEGRIELDLAGTDKSVYRDQ